MVGVGKGMEKAKADAGVKFLSEHLTVVIQSEHRTSLHKYVNFNDKCSKLQTMKLRRYQNLNYDHMLPKLSHSPPL